MPLVEGSDSASVRYQVPVVYADESPASALLSAFDSLKQLNVICDQVFTRLTQRVNQSKNQLQSFTQRLNNASNAIQQIANNTNRVTTIYSTAKYPAPPKLNDFTLAIPLPHTLNPNTSDTTSNTQNDSTGGKPKLSLKQKLALSIPADTAPLLNSLSEARLNRFDNSKLNQDEQVSEGLGRLPSYLPSVTSILLFNTDENPYKSYVSINNLEGVIAQDRKTDSTGPSAAPKFVLDDLPMYSGFQYDYKPMMGELPSFELPANLPLGKLADISFNQTQQLSIAPSNAPLLQLPTFDMLALPDVASTSRKEKISAVPAFNAANANNQNTNNNANSGNSNTSVNSAPVVGSDIPPPPGPPEAPPLSIPPPPDAPPVSVAPTSVKAPSSSADGGRSALLDAIRDKSNMARLKKAKAAGGPGPAAGPGASKKAAAPKESSGGGGMDMMSALRDRLAARQHAISGKNQDDVVKAPSTMQSQARKLSVPRFDRSKTTPLAGQSQDNDNDENENGADENENFLTNKNSSRFADVAKLLIEKQKAKELADTQDEWKEEE